MIYYSKVSKITLKEYYASYIYQPIGLDVMYLKWNFPIYLIPNKQELGIFL